MTCGAASGGQGKKVDSDENLSYGWKTAARRKMVNFAVLVRLAARSMSTSRPHDHRLLL